MAKNTLTFDPSSGVAYGVNLTLNTGADLDADYTVVGTSGTAFDLLDILVLLNLLRV
jgi:hypothetical protein